ncbi:hemagglutinin repeat-containing protein, partial [Conchiformibius steedae]
VETDPAFANYRQWLGSDYMLRALSLDPANMHKRLGDGYYEQKLVNEQINRLTGFRRLDGYQSDEEQFKALMNSGVTAAKAMGLTPGIALTAEQVARLTADIVWLETQTVTLPDGSTQTVLVPKVYVVARSGDLNGSGSLISADSIRLNIHNGTVKNGGTIGARQVVAINARDIENSGQLQADKIGLQADNAILFDGGTARAESLLSLKGRDIRLNTTTATSGDRNNGQTVVERVAGLYVSGNKQGDGLLSVEAYNNATLAGVRLENNAQNGQTQVLAQNDLLLDTVKTEKHESYGELSDDNHRHVHQSAEVGTSIRAKGNVLLSAGNNATIRQGDIASDQSLTVRAGKHVSIVEGRRTLDLDDAVRFKSKGILSKREDKSHYRRQADEAVGSSLKAKDLAVLSGGTVQIRGANLNASEQAVVRGEGNVSITAAHNHYINQDSHQSRKSGLTGGFSKGVATLGYNKSHNRSDTHSEETTLTRSQINSEGGLLLHSGGHLNTEAAVLTAGGDMLVEGKHVRLGEAHTTYRQTAETESKNKGINVSLNLVPGEVRGLQKKIDTIKGAKGKGALQAWQTVDRSHLDEASERFRPALSVSLARSGGKQRSQTDETQAVASQVRAGGKVIVKGTESDIDIRGANVHSDKGTVLAAKRDVKIVSAVAAEDLNTDVRSSRAGIDQEGLKTFIGNTHQGQGQQQRRTLNQSARVSSNGTLNVQAGRHYIQDGSSVRADGNITVSARSINVRAAEDRHTATGSGKYTQKGVTVGISTPISSVLDSAGQTLDSAGQIGQSKNDRTNAMAAANTAWQGYQTAKAAQNIAQNGANVQVSVTYGQQHNRNSHSSTQTTAAAADLHSGGQLTLHTTGGADSDINIIGSDVSGKGGTRLLSAGKINILPAEQQHSERSNSRSAGGNAGVAVSYGSNGLALGVTAGGNYGKGHGNSDSTTYRHSTVGDAGSQTVLQSHGKTTLKGGQVLGKGVLLDAQDLAVRSVQDTATYDSKQQNIQGQITVGYGFSASGDFNKSKLNADYAGVSKQSGILAGEDGFQVRVKGHTDLKGGLISSSQSAEAAGKNHFSTGTLSHSDIENHSRYKGKSIGLGGGFGFNGKGSQELGDTGIKLAAQGQHTGGVANGEGLQGAKASKSIGYGQDSDSQSSVTRSGIGTKTIHIGNDISGEQARAVYTDTTTETAAARSGSLGNHFDAGKVQSELDLQRSVSQAFDSNRQAAKAEINQKRTELEEKLKEKTLSVEEAQVYQKEIDKLDNLALLLDTVSAGLYTPSNSTGGSLMAASSPAMTQKIGEIFKPGGTLEKYEGTALHGAAQGIWAAAVAYAGGNDPLSAGVSAGVSEVAVPVLGNWLFPGKDKADYTVEEKQTLSAIAGMLSAGGTLAAGGSATDAAAANGAAMNAVENNNFKKIQEDALEKLQNARKYLNEQGKKALDSLVEAYKKGDIQLAKQYKSQLDDAIEKWATSGQYEILGIKPKAAVGAMAYAVGELMIPTNATEIIPIGKLGKAKKALKLPDNVLTTAPEVAIFEKLKTIRSDRYKHLTDLQLQTKISYVMQGQKTLVNSGKTIYISPDKKDILIIDPLNPMGGTMFPNDRNTKRTSEYLNNFIREEGGVKW